MKRKLVDLSRAQLERERRCAGLSAGWYLAGTEESWYGRQACERRRSVWRWLLGHPCRECTREALRRGFRVNYEVSP